MSWCCTDPSMARPGKNKCANSVLAACSRASAKGVVTVTPGALDSGKSARRGRAPGTLPRRVGHPSRRCLEDLRQARSHGEAHCVEAGLAQRLLKTFAKASPRSGARPADQHCWRPSAAARKRRAAAEHPR